MKKEYENYLIEEYGNSRIAPLAGEEITSQNEARLWLNDATAQVLKSGLFLLGVSAPERM